MTRLFAVLVLALSLSACEMHEPTKLNQNRVQLEQTDIVQKFTVDELDERAIAVLADAYNRTSNDVIDMTVMYDPSSRKNTAMSAGTHAARITDMFRKRGVKALNANILPVNGQGDEAQVLMTYTAYNALPPKDCSQMAGMQGSDIEAEADYKLGCSIETVFAKQVARPKDLAGQTLSGTTDGRGAANIVDAHRTGAAKEPLDGETASE